MNVYTRAMSCPEGTMTLDEAICCESTGMPPATKIKFYNGSSHILQHQTLNREVND